MMARETNPAVTVRYKKIDGDALKDRIARIFTPRPWNGLVTAVRYGGKGSESTPYINPTLKAQLETCVQKNFKPYPSDRTGADDNGFPIERSRARKIYIFFLAKAKTSEDAQVILERGNYIRNNEGLQAMFDYYLGFKEARP